MPTRNSCSLTTAEQGELVRTTGPTKNLEIIRQMEGNIYLARPVCKLRRNLYAGQVTNMSPGLSLNGASVIMVAFWRLDA